MGQELATDIALCTVWVNGDMESWTALVAGGIEHDRMLAEEVDQPRTAHRLDWGSVADLGAWATDLTT